MATTVRVQLKVLGQPIDAEVPMPPAMVRIDAVLPLLRQLDDKAVDLAVAKTENETGERVSCSKGCSACCRSQPVPVTPPEAYALWLLVSQLPEPRQTEIRNQFAVNVAALRAAGLVDRYLDRPRTLRVEDAIPIARAYFALGLDCPFLSDHACSIYTERPFVCRQYLVTSPVAMCSNPFDEPVRGVPTAVRFAHAMLDTGEAFLKISQETIPLALALEYVEMHKAELEQEFPAEAVFRDAITRLSTLSKNKPE